MNPRLDTHCRSALVRVLLLAALTGFLCVLVFQSNSHASDYGAKTTFKKDVTLVFPNFDLTYLGERSVLAPPYPRPFVYHDFRVARAGQAQTLSWSSGTGDIGPAVFSFAGKNYALELRQSDRRGKLAQDELVIERRSK